MRSLVTDSRGKCPSKSRGRVNTAESRVGKHDIPNPAQTRTSWTKCGPRESQEEHNQREVATRPSHIKRPLGDRSTNRKTNSRAWHLSIQQHVQNRAARTRNTCRSATSTSNEDGHPGPATCIGQYKHRTSSEQYRTPRALTHRNGPEAEAQSQPKCAGERSGLLDLPKGRLYYTRSGDVLPSAAFSLLAPLSRLLPLHPSNVTCLFKGKNYSRMTCMQVFPFVL